MSKSEVIKVKILLRKLTLATKALREAQKEYMLNRGNHLLGQEVAKAAREVDLILAEVDNDG